MKKKYEIGNPSDKCFITGDIETEKEALYAVIVILGNGMYFLIDIETDKSIFGGMSSGVLDFWEEEFGRSLERCLSDNATMAQTAEIFESFEYDGERSSMNDIGGTAKSNAKSIRKFLAKATQ